MIVAVRHQIREAQEQADGVLDLIRLLPADAKEAFSLRAEWRDTVATIVKLREQLADAAGIAKRPADLKGRGRGSQAPPVDAQVVSDGPGNEANGLSGGLDAEPLP